MRGHSSVVIALLFVAFQHAPAAQVVAPGGPQRLLLLVDSSTATQRMINSIRTGLLAFLDDLPGNAEIMLVTSGGPLRLRVKPTTERDQVRKAIGEFSSDGGSNTFVPTMLEANDRFLKTAPDKRPIIVIVTTEMTSQLDYVNIDAYNRFMNEFRQRGGRAHAVVIGGTASGLITDIARNLCENTGGRFSRILDATALTKLAKNIAAELAADLR